MTATWYNAERVSQPGSVILNRWMADRQAAKTPQNAGVSYDSSLGTKGSELYDWITGGISSAGTVVNERTAMGVSTVYACVSLIGGAIAINQDVAAMAANAKSILFGDFKRYTIRDVMGMTLFRFDDSAYAKLGQVGFLAWMRSGGTKTDGGAPWKHYANSAT